MSNVVDLRTGCGTVLPGAATDTNHKPAIGVDREQPVVPRLTDRDLRAFDTHTVERHRR